MRLQEDHQQSCQFSIIFYFFSHHNSHYFLYPLLILACNPANCNLLGPPSMGCAHKIILNKDNKNMCKDMSRLSSKNGTYKKITWI